MSARIALFSLAAVTAFPLAAFAELPTPMIGRQSQNEGIRGVPAPGPVKIDGDLSDWDLSGRIWSFADIAIRDRYSAESAVMWDKDFVYLALKFRDPNPLVNTIDPSFDPQSGWKGDAVQLRILTDWPLWVTLWKHSPSARSAMLFNSWKDVENPSKGTNDTLLISEPNATSLGQGIEMATLIDEGRGYIQEVKIPWKLLYKNAPEIKAGDTFRMGMEFFWGRAGESAWPAHRYTDNLQKGATSREFFWTAKKAWGEVELLPKGNVETFTYIPAGGKIQGTIPLKFTIPASAKEFTVVIETTDGKRIRNLGAQLDAELYSTSVNGENRSVEVLWDGRDDDLKMVPAETYSVRGLTHEGLGADYVMTFYNPGTPPWESGDKGNWGADHGPPSLTAAAGDWTIVAWEFAEGGRGVIGIGPNGLKKWGEKRGARALAADERSVYFISNSWHTSGALCRLDRTKGTYKPFKLDGKERPFELTLTDVFGSEEAVPGKVIAMASSGQQIALAMTQGKIVLLDCESAKVVKIIDAAAVNAVAFSHDGRLFATSENKLVEVTMDTDTLRPIPTPGVVLKAKEAIPHGAEVSAITANQKILELAAESLTIDPQGNIGLLDVTDQQVKFFSPAGALVYAVGKKGGRAIRGDFDEQAMSHVSSIATNKQGETWATESWEFPRRVSIWGRDGKLIRDYIGNTGYSGTGAFLHDEDPTLAYYGPVEMKLDLEKRTWKVTKILWVPGEGENFRINVGSHTHPHRFSSNAGGKKREFMFAPPYLKHQSYVLFMEDDKGWRPVSAIGTLGDISGKLARRGEILEQPDGEFAGHNGWDGYIWNDLNVDGRVQKSETTIIPQPKPVEVGKSGKLMLPLFSGWGTRMAPEDLSFFTNGVTRFSPIRFTDEGAPVFGIESIHSLNEKTDGDFVPLLAEKSIIALTNRGYNATTGLQAINTETGTNRWTYPNPYPSVHGSHRATMPQPGLLIGPLKILGTAELPDHNGHVFGLRGNLGQDFYFTSDGLFIGTVFQDGRLPSMSLPEKESDLIGSPMESFGGGAEPFSGWFGKHSDGKVRFTSGIAGQAAIICEMKGLDRIKRFTAPAITVADETLKQAALANDRRDAEARKGAEKKQIVTRISAPLSIGGKQVGWNQIPAFDVISTASNFKGKARLAYDADTLYLALEVEDPSPWKNEGVDPTRLFKTGDAVDLQLATDPAANPKRDQPAKGDLRIVLADLAKKPAAILMRPIHPEASGEARKTYTSPVGDKKFDEVRPLEEVRVAVEIKAPGYRIEAAIPLASIGLKPEPGKEFRGDLGFVSSDTAGRINMARTYWANQSTNLVADEPIEAWFNPAAWGTFTWGE